jgi:hypothetical protein
LNKFGSIGIVWRVVGHVSIDINSNALERSLNSASFSHRSGYALQGRRPVVFIGVLRTGPAIMVRHITLAICITSSKLNASCSVTGNSVQPCTGLKLPPTAGVSVRTPCPSQRPSCQRRHPQRHSTGLTILVGMPVTRGYECPRRFFLERLFSIFSRTWTRGAINVYICRNNHVPTHA